MANYGTQTQLASGTIITQQSMPGGRVYLGVIVQAQGSSATYTYPEVPGGTYIRLIWSAGGPHTATLGTNTSGQATVTVTATPFNFVTASSRIHVFATKTTEPNYGIEMVNDAGERTISSIFLCPEFLGKISQSSFSGLTPGYADQVYYFYDIYPWRATTSIGAGRERLILWKIPAIDPANDTWFNGMTYIPSTVTGTYNVDFYHYVYYSNYYDLRADFGLAEPYIFALDGLTASTDSYGMRVYNASGQVCYDTGKSHLVPVGIDNSLSYPIGSYASTTPSFLSGVTAPLVSHAQGGSWIIGSGLNSTYTNVINRSSTGMQGQRLLTNAYPQGGTSTVQYGPTTGITQVFANSALYG